MSMCTEFDVHLSSVGMSQSSVRQARRCSIDQEIHRIVCLLFSRQKLLIVIMNNVKFGGHGNQLATRAQLRRTQRSGVSMSAARRSKRHEHVH